MIRYCETKKHRPKIVLPLPVLCMEILDDKTFLKHRRVPLQCFSVHWDRKLPKESCDNPLLSRKISDSIFLKHRMAPPRCFLVLWDHNFPIENRDFPLLGIKFFDTRYFLKHRRVPQKKNFGFVRRKFFDGRSWYSCHPPPPLSSLTFSDTKSFLKHRSVPLRNVSVQWDKNIDGESWYPPLIYKVLR